MRPLKLLEKASVEYATVNAGSIKTSYLAAGSGCPVLLIHGGGSGAIAWHAVISSLANAFSVIAPDVVGYGESDKPNAVYDRRFFAAWLRDFTNALELERIRLVGHSLGGAIALQFILENPERVEQLVLVSSAGFKIPAPVIPFLQGLWLYSFPSISTSQWMHTSLVYEQAHINRALVEYAAEVCRKPGGKRAFWQGRWKALAPIPYVQLQTINQPTMIVWGAEDRIFPAAYGRLAQQRIQHAQLEVIPRAGHVPFYDEPDIFNNLLLTFLGG